MRLIYCGFFLLLLGASCRSTKKLSKDYVYFQNGTDSMVKAQFSEPVIQNNDLLSIQVFSGGISQEQASVFNIPNGSSGSVGGTGSGSSVASASSGGTSTSNGYQVAMDGKVEIPVLGKLQASGLTRAELEKSIARKLDSLGLVKAPFVLVKFNQFKVNVLGEVKTPGQKIFNTDRANIIEAIAMSGDLSDEGRRDNIVLIREEKDGRKMYTMDIRDGSIFQSPAYQLQQNDIIYVSPRKTKLRNLNVNTEFQRNLSLGLTLLSFITSVVGFSYTIYTNRK